MTQLPMVEHEGLDYLIRNRVAPRARLELPEGIQKVKTMSNEATLQAVPQLETTRLVLRALVPGDADDIFAYAADPEVAHYTVWSAHTTIEDSRQFIAWISGGRLACWGLVQPGTRQ